MAVVYVHPIRGSGPRFREHVFRPNVDGPLHRLPGYIDSFHKVNLWIRQPVQGRVALAMINTSFDPAKDVTLKLLTGHDKIRVYDMAGKPTSIQSSGTDGPYRVFVLPEIGDWSMNLVVTE